MPAPVRPQPYKVEPNAVNVPKGLVGYYTDLEIDALLASLPAGGGNVDLTPYATTVYVDDEIAKVYSKAEIDQLLVDLASGGTIGLDGYATKEELADALANLPAPDLTGYAKSEDLSIVYEQNAEPTGKDGDLWLKPMAASEEAQAAAAAMSKDALSSEIQRVISDQPKPPTEPEVRAIVRSMISGGSKEPPPDKDWTATVFQQGTGLIEAKLTNGVLRLRGELTFTYTSGGTYTTVRVLPNGFPKPEVACNAVVTGKENGVAFRFVSVKLTPEGALQLCATGGKITHVDFTGFTAYIGT